MIISRYLTRSVLKTTMVITMVLLLAFISQQLVRYLNYVAVGKIPTSILLQLVSFEIPYLLALLLPLGLYLGILLAYGRMYVDNEMAILQLNGIDQYRLVRMSLWSIGLVVTVILILMLWLNPWVASIRQAVMASDEATMHMIQTLIPGRFQVSADGKKVMYVEKLSRDHARAKGIFMAEIMPEVLLQEGNRPWSVEFAKVGYQYMDPMSKEPFFVTHHGQRYQGIPGQNDFNITHFATYQVRVPQNEVKISHDREETLSTQALWRDYHNPLYAAELQWRVSIAINAFLLAVLAIPLSAKQPRNNRYIGIFPAILFYIVYFNILLVAKHMVEQAKVPIGLGVWWVHMLVLMCICSFYLFNKLQARWA